MLTVVRGFSAITPALLLAGAGILVLGGGVIPAVGEHPDGSDRGPTAAQARTEFFAAIDRTQQLAGGDWSINDDTRARGCVMPTGGSGTTYPALRLSSEPNSPVTISSAISAVASAWASWGYSVDRGSIGPVVQLLGTDERGATLIFRASSAAMTLQGESECLADGPG